MATASVVMLLCYSALMAVTLFAKNKQLLVTKLLIGVGIIIALLHTVLFFLNGSHWLLPFCALLLYLGCAVANGFILKKPHVLHWIIRLVISSVILIFYFI